MKIRQRKSSGEGDQREMIRLASSLRADTLHSTDLPYRLYELVGFRLAREVFVYRKDYNDMAARQSVN